MVDISIKKGLDIPLEGKPSGPVQKLVAAGEAKEHSAPVLALNVESFDCGFHLLAKAGEHVKCGDPILEKKGSDGVYFVSPASGLIKEIQRGEKRAIRNILIQLDPHQENKTFTPVSIEKASREELVSRLKEGGLFSKISMRPFGILADPRKEPRYILVKAIESAPCIPPAELQVEGYEKQFQAGLNALTKLTKGKVHLVYRKGSSCKAFTEAVNVDKHTAEGPHPVGNASLHIQKIDPIRSVEDCIWTLTAHDVVSIGILLTEDRVHMERVIGIGGNGILQGRTGYFKVREGYPIEALISGRVAHGNMRLISGDPLNGHQVTVQDYLGFTDYAFTVIPEMSERQMLHFFRLGAGKYSFSKAYLSGHLDNQDRSYPFTTSLHGEPRPFIDATLYDKVQPLDISTMLLVKAVMAEDYDLAETLGLLEVVPEDFALPAFVCPSKVEMPSIIKAGQKVCIQALLQG